MVLIIESQRDLYCAESISAGEGKSQHNGHYLLLFMNPRDKLQNLTLAKQMYPRQTYFFLNQYEEAVKRPFGYLLIDLKTTTQDNCPLRKKPLAQ